jgi:hypothetical protein
MQKRPRVDCRYEFTTYPNTGYTLEFSAAGMISVPSLNHISSALIPFSETKTSVPLNTQT